MEANPEKIQTIEAMRPPARIKDVQKLAGYFAALSQFIYRLAERALSFFKLLQKFGPLSGPRMQKRHSRSSRGILPHRQ
jgi:hypothetical protein